MSAEPIIIEAWIHKGEFDGNEKTLAEAIQTADTLLDRNESHEIVGYAVFKATNGKFYTANVEINFIECDPPEDEE